MPPQPIPTTVLPQQAYDQRYFDGGQHPGLGGYSSYKRMPLHYAGEFEHDGPHFPEEKNSFKCPHEYFARQSKNIFDRFGLQGRRVLDLGCAKGFHVKSLIDMGAIATGVDWSPYALSHCEPEVKSFLKNSEVLAYLQTLPNQSFDVIIGLRLLPCLPATSISSFFTQVKRVAPLAYFTTDSVDTDGNAYNVLPAGTWQSTGGVGIIVEEYKSTER